MSKQKLQNLEFAQSILSQVSQVLHMYYMYCVEAYSYNQVFE